MPAETVTNENLDSGNARGAISQALPPASGALMDGFLLPLFVVIPAFLVAGLLGVFLVRRFARGKSRARILALSVLGFAAMSAGALYVLARAPNVYRVELRVQTWPERNERVLLNGEVLGRTPHSLPLAALKRFYDPQIDVGHLDPDLADSAVVADELAGYGLRVAVYADPERDGTYVVALEERQHGRVSAGAFRLQVLDEDGRSESFHGLRSRTDSILTRREHRQELVFGSLGLTRVDLKGVAGESE